MSQICEEVVDDNIASVVVPKGLFFSLMHFTIASALKNMCLGLKTKKKWSTFNHQIAKTLPRQYHTYLQFCH